MAERRFAARLGVRARTTLVAVVVVAFVLAAGAVAFLVITEDRIEASLVARATARAEAVAAVVDAGALIDPLPGSDPELVTQIVRDGRVIASDGTVAGAGPLAVLAPEVGVRDRVSLASLPIPTPIGDDPPFAVVAIGIAVEGRPAVVLVAVSLDDAAELVPAATPVLALGLPGLLVIVAVVTWVLTGRALRPVEWMRTEAEQISATARHRRLPVPETSDEVHRLATTLNAMLERLDASALRQRRFVSDAAHELRSPLAVLLAIADAADPASATDEQRRLLADARAEVERLQVLVDDLLVLARHDETPTSRRVEVDLDQTIRGVLTGPDRTGGVTVDTSGVEPVRLHGDPGALERMIRNLVDNAVRHAETAVWVGLAARHGQAVVTVDDDGPGIVEEAREHVFERFARVDEARARATGGAGLGLAVVRAVARAHGGDARIIEPRRGGASVEVRLPLGRPGVGPNG